MARASSTVHYRRMTVAIFNLLLDNGVVLKLFSDLRGWKFVSDFCLAQAHGIAQAAVRFSLR